MTDRKAHRIRKQPGRILDLFAGAGGWEEALATLGLSALGIETDPWACETAQAAGHDRLQADVAELDPLRLEPVWGLVGSPPCQRQFVQVGNAVLPPLARPVIEGTMRASAAKRRPRTRTSAGRGAAGETTEADMKIKDRLTDRLKDRLRDRLSDRPRFRRALQPLPVFSCSHAGFWQRRFCENSMCAGHYW